MSEKITPGVLVRIHPRVRRITAPNPGMMTGPGTNAYVIGDEHDGPLALIDPGPDIESHIAALIQIAGTRLKWILCTHTHRDHSPAANAVRAATGAQVYGFGRVPADGRQDEAFTPDVALVDGDEVVCGAFSLRVVHTPGHASNHLCYLLQPEQLLFTGDHVMQGSTVVIAPPDGDMHDYFASLKKLDAMDIRAFAPGHGTLIDTPREETARLVAHRLKREQKVVDALSAMAVGTLDDLVVKVYDDVSPQLHVPAKRSLYAHLLKLAKEGRVSAEGESWRML